ncbi:hypothetical protein [Nitratidesulfovibrio sp. SRB-5]|uniref:hypothetical protein n=1 Tax=Nitratidesulfovibrio sp. SRB-5 TaxID=2872636 RepID=UPI001026865C|nr:hypothetical protein [Nitratidesulfovibrio sp. SRB-5]MBZ2171402.1 hypothetical protein [Nitratidesulfovibrio sp. SRB-5]RXF77622.1 hypothetical protein EKK70_05880 [Desulfovibrio sp. DS-1]
MSRIADVEALCRLGMLHLHKEEPDRAKRLFLRAWQAMPEQTGIASLLAQAHRAEAVRRHAEHGCNGRMLFVIRGYFLSYFLPVLRLLPPDRVDVDTGGDSWGVDGAARAEVLALGFGPCEHVPRPEWWRYAMVAADHAIQMHFPVTGPEDVLPPVVAYLAHNTTYAGGAVHPYQSHCIYPFEALALQQRAQAPWQQCLFTGPYQFTEEMLRLMFADRAALRGRAMRELGQEDRGGPLVVCYASALDNCHEVADGLRGLADALHPQGGLVVLKPFPDDVERYAALDMGRALVWSRSGAGGNELRMAADCVLCGLAGSTLLSVFLTGQRVLPYHTEQEREYCEGSRDRQKLRPRGTVRPDANPRGQAIIAGLGGSCSIADVPALQRHLEALLDDAEYPARNEAIRLSVLGRSDVRHGARRTAELLLSLLDGGRTL